MEIGPVSNGEAIELKELVSSAALRRERMEYVVEGPHLLESAYQSVPKLIRDVFATEVAREEHRELFEGLRRSGLICRSISQKNAERISDTKTTQGIFALISMPKRAKNSTSEKLILALDNLQDPGNVGTILRTAAWFGIEQIIATKATADCYSPKVIRATQGAIFQLSVEYADVLHSRLLEEKRAGSTIVGSSLSQKSIDLVNYRPLGTQVLVLGSEAHGISGEVEEVCDVLVRIPRKGAGESLNVAVSCGILLDRLS